MSSAAFVAENAFFQLQLVEIQPLLYDTWPKVGPARPPKRGPNPNRHHIPGIGTMRFAGVTIPMGMIRDAWQHPLGPKPNRHDFKRWCKRMRMHVAVAGDELLDGDRANALAILSEVMNTDRAAAWIKAGETGGATYTRIGGMSSATWRRGSLAWMAGI